MALTWGDGCYILYGILRGSRDWAFLSGTWASCLTSLDNINQSRYRSKTGTMMDRNTPEGRQVALAHLPQCADFAQADAGVNIR